jgi:IS5 family transposase
LPVPWPALCRLAEPFYPKPGNGRPPIGMGRVLRLYSPQQWNLVIASYR